MLSSAFTQPTWASTILLYLIIGSAFLHIIGYLTYKVVKTHCDEVKRKTQEGNDLMQLSITKGRLERLIKDEQVQHWGMVETWKQYVRYAESHPEAVKQALQFSQQLEDRLDEQ